MLTYEDCLGLGHFTEDEIQAIAEHEHVPQLIALEIGEYLIRDAQGVQKIRRIILDDIEAATRQGNHEHREKLMLVLGHFLSTHPERGS